MFFGLFSTHLPFVVVGIIYFLSFALASLNAFSSAANEDAFRNAPSPINYNSPQSVSTQTPDLPYLHDIQVDIVCLDTQTVPISAGVITRFLISEQPYFKCPTFQNHYVRPPPLLS